jgi:hypothetical protein
MVAQKTLASLHERMTQLYEQVEVIALCVIS